MRIDRIELHPIRVPFDTGAALQSRVGPAFS